MPSSFRGLSPEAIRRRLSGATRSMDDTSDDDEDEEHDVPLVRRRHEQHQPAPVPAPASVSAVPSSQNDLSQTPPVFGMSSQGMPVFPANRQSPFKAARTETGPSSAAPQRSDLSGWEEGWGEDDDEEGSSRLRRKRFF